MDASSQEKIGLSTATIVGMNAMIGAGIFVAPAALASNVGPAGILTYAFVIVAVWCMGLSMARLAQLYPEEGSFYIYAKQWGGHVLGLIATGSYFVGLLVAMGLLAQKAGSYLFEAFPILSENAWGLLLLATLTILNMLGVTMSEFGQMILIICTVFPLLSTIAICFTKTNLANLTPFMPYGFTNVLSATRAVIFGFFGFECAASLFRIVKNPERNVPKALTYGIMLVGMLYLLFVTSLIVSVPLSYFADPTLSVTKILKTVFPNQTWLITLIHLSILSAIVGTIHSMLWSSSELLISYASKFKSRSVQNLLTSGRLNDRSSVFLVGFCIFLSYITFKNQDLFFSLTAIFLIFAFAVSMLTLLTLKSEWKSKQNLITLIGLATATVIFCFAVEGIKNSLS